MHSFQLKVWSLASWRRIWLTICSSPSCVTIGHPILEVAVLTLNSPGDALLCHQIFLYSEKSLMDSENLILTYRNKKQNKIQDDWEF